MKIKATTKNQNLKFKNLNFWLAVWSTTKSEKIMSLQKNEIMNIKSVPKSLDSVSAAAAAAAAAEASPSTVIRDKVRDDKVF